MTSDLDPLKPLTEVAKALLDRVSDGLGGFAKPWQIKRVAKAEGEAKKIHALADIEVSEIEQRGLIRMVREQGRDQENIEQITMNAIPHLSENAKSEDIEEDWLAHFFDRSRIVSDQEMQTLWSKILAGEANNPGGFSKRTIDLVGSLDKRDAQLFSGFCVVVWVFEDGLKSLVTGMEQQVLNDLGIDFPSISHLNNIGLVDFVGLGGYHMQGDEQQWRASYFGRELVLSFPTDSGNRVDLGLVRLTETGAQLAPLSGAKPSEDYFSSVLSEWMTKGIAVSTRISDKPPSG